jgi:acylphosphatase
MSVSGGDTTLRLDAVVHGLVQGVGFRWFVVRQADQLRLTGWTANEADGSVRVVAEGPARALDELLARLREGPSGASVERVDATQLAASGEFRTFAIRSGAHRGD